MARSELTTPATSRSGAVDRIGFAVWATAFAVGVLLHEWQKGEPLWSWNTVAAVAAIGVLLRPASVPRMMVLFATQAVELAVELPAPLNHSVVAGVIGGAVVLWWLGVLVRSPFLARDPGYVHAQILPFLRVGFILVFFAAAFSKLNTGFFELATTCAAWIMESVPLVTVPTGLRPPLVVGAVLIEFAIPALLIFRRTRPLAIVLGFGFHALSAIAGHTAFAGYAWSFYLAFLPSGVLARAAALTWRPFGTDARRRVEAMIRGPLAWTALTAVLVLALVLLHLLPVALQPQVRRWGAALPYLGWSALWFVLLFALRRHWLTLRGTPFPPGGLRMRNGVFLAALVLIVVNAASPYVGLKTRYSFTMYSNLHTEAGYWNHMVLPESMRIFHLQDTVVHLSDISDPDLAAELAYRGGTSLLLPDLQRLATKYPDASVRYELNGQVRTASPLGGEALIGDPVSPLLHLLGGFRPVETDNRCLH